MSVLDEVMEEAKQIINRSPSTPTIALYKLVESFYQKMNQIPNEKTKLDVEQVILFLLSGLFVGTPMLEKITRRRIEIFEKILEDN